MNKIFAATFGLFAVALVAVLLTYRQGLAPAPSDEGLPADAPALFEQVCVQCHGKRGEGIVNITPPLRGRGLPPGRVKAQIQRGGEKMPALPFIQGEALERLAGYVSGLK